MFSQNGTFRAVCPHNCYDTCGLLLHLEKGRLSSVTGDPEHPITRGIICRKVQQYPSRVYHPQRLTHPLKRTGSKGNGQFAPISWEEAFSTIAHRFQQLTDQYGSESLLPYSYSGTLGMINNDSMDKRFFHRAGASLLERTICSTAGRVGYISTVGAAQGVDPVDIPHARLIIIWGNNPVATNMHFLPLLQKAKRNGAKIVLIDPHRTPVARLADIHLPIYPGSDAALALGMMKLILDNGWENKEYLAHHTLGLEQLLPDLAQYDLTRVSRETRLTVRQIEGLAYDYTHIQPTLIRTGHGMQRHINGGMMIRAIACLSAFNASWQHQGGGMLHSNSGYQEFNKTALTRPDLLSRPVRSINMNQIGEALLHAVPPIKGLYVYNSNPAAVAPEQNKVWRGLAREDLFLVVHDQFMTDTARFADILLPATTQFEQWDLHHSYWHLYLQLNRPVLKPPGECRPNYQVFAQLAQTMGFDDACFRDGPEDLIRTALAGAKPALTETSLKDLWEGKPVRIQVKSPILPFAGKFATPSGKLELYSNTLKQQGLPALPSHNALGDLMPGEKNLPFILISPSAQYFLNSSFANLPEMQAAENQPTVKIHPLDAQNKGIATGDLLTIRNLRGKCQLTAMVSEDTRPGVLISPTVWWPADSSENRNVNATVADTIADFGGGATFYSNFVDIDPLIKP